MLLSIGVGAGIGYAEWLISRYWAPWLLLPALSGLAGGIIWCGVVRMLPVAGQRVLLYSASCFALIAGIVTPHWIAYHTFQAEIEPETRMMARLTASDGEPILPGSFGGFLVWSAERGRFIGSRKIVGRWVWGSWMLDALLFAIGFFLPVGDLMKKPYCHKCDYWLRPILGQNVSLRTAKRALECCSLSADIREQHVQEPLRLRVMGCRDTCGGFMLQLYCVGRRDPVLEQTLSPAKFAQLSELLESSHERNSSSRC
ncbi:hypothetical protein JCM19992_22190 [Thermostilla marina]